MSVVTLAATQMACSWDLDDNIAGITNRGMLEDILNVPVLHEIAHGQRELALG